MKNVRAMWTKDVAVIKHHITAAPVVSPEKGCLSSSSQLLQLPPIVGDTQDKEVQDPGPRQLRCYQRNDFGEPRRLHLPTQSKVLRSLT